MTHYCFLRLMNMFLDLPKKIYLTGRHTSLALYQSIKFINILPY